MAGLLHEAGSCLMVTFFRKCVGNDLVWLDSIGVGFYGPSRVFDGSAVVTSLVVDSCFCTIVATKYLVTHLETAIGVGRLHVEKLRRSMEAMCTERRDL